jgi:hypothetical protein
MSIAASANEAMPAPPYHQACARRSRQIASIWTGSRPSTSGATPRTSSAVAREASGHIVTASPQPTAPSSVVTRTRHRCRSAPSSFGSG